MNDYLQLGQLVVLSGMLATVVVMAVKGGRFAGRIETMLGIHSDGIKSLWKEKQDKDVCLVRHRGRSYPCHGSPPLIWQ